MCGLAKLAWMLLIVAVATVQAKRIKQPSAAILARGTKPESRVIGGTNAEPGFAPYQISLQSMFLSHMCGGAIISAKYAITAAHCVFGYNPPYLRVVTGTHDWTKPGAVYEVEEYWVHCNFDNPDYHNDIALIRTIDKIKMDEFTQAIPLPTEPMKEGDDVILTGWGSTEVWGDLADILQKVTLKYVKHQKCVEMMGGDESVDVGHICTFTRAGEGSCHGDSGGPLVSNGKLVGLVNWGYPCATGSPDMHASVLYYTDWIKKTMSRCRECQCYASNYPTFG